MREVVINRCYGAFGLSESAKARLGIKYDFEMETRRDDPELIAIVKELGTRADREHFSKLKIVEIPDEATDWKLCEYDGIEWITAVIDGKIVEIT